MRQLVSNQSSTGLALGYVLPWAKYNIAPHSVRQRVHHPRRFCCTRVGMNSHAAKIEPLRPARSAGLNNLRGARFGCALVLIVCGTQRQLILRSRSLNRGTGASPKRVSIHARVFASKLSPDERKTL